MNMIEMYLSHTSNWNKQTASNMTFNDITIKIHGDLVLETSYYLYYILFISLKEF